MIKDETPRARWRMTVEIPPEDAELLNQSGLASENAKEVYKRLLQNVREDFEQFLSEASEGETESTPSRNVEVVFYIGEETLRTTFSISGSAAFDDDQSYFWTDQWQAAEREVDNHIEAGRFTDYDSIDAFLGDLDVEEDENA